MHFLTEINGYILISIITRRDQHKYCQESVDKDKLFICILVQGGQGWKSWLFFLEVKTPYYSREQFVSCKYSSPWEW